MKGQRIRIRVVQPEYLNEHKLHRYRYEVISKGSRFFGNLGFIHSAHPLKAGHHY